MLTDLLVRRGGKPVPRVDGSAASGRFTFDYPAFAPTSSVTLEIVGRTRTVSCLIDRATLGSFR